jgi:hypothetical protein
VGEHTQGEHQDGEVDDENDKHGANERPNGGRFEVDPATVILFSFCL